jgi:hypothetical protein
LVASFLNKFALLLLLALKNKLLSVSSLLLGKDELRQVSILLIELVSSFDEALLLLVSLSVVCLSGDEFDDITEILNSLSSDLIGNDIVRVLSLNGKYFRVLLLIDCLVI